MIRRVEFNNMDLLALIAMKILCTVYNFVSVFFFFFGRGELSSCCYMFECLYTFKEDSRCGPVAH